MKWWPVSCTRPRQQQQTNLGDRAVLHVSWVDPSPVVTIDNFHLCYIEASYTDKDTQETRRIFAYYSKIHQIVKA